MANNAVNPPANQRQDLCWGLDKEYCENGKHK